MIEKDDSRSLDGVREQVRVALNGGSGYASSSPIAAFFATNKAPKLNLVRRRRTRKESRENSIGPWGRTVHAKESRRSGKSRPLIHHQSDTEMMQRINSLEERYQLMLRHLYMNDPPRFYGERLKRILWEDYTPKLKKKAPETRLIVSDMLELQLISAANPLAQAGLLTRPWEHMNIPRPSWYKTYAPHWQAIRYLIERTDVKALLLVAL